MVKEHSIKVRYQAIGQLEAGKPQSAVATDLGVGLRTIKRWHCQGESLQNRPGRGRKTKLTRVDKITNSKSIGKRRQSTRKLDGRLSKDGRKVSHETIRKYLKDDLNLKMYKPQLQP